MLFRVSMGGFERVSGLRVQGLQGLLLAVGFKSLGFVFAGLLSASKGLQGAKSFKGLQCLQRPFAAFFLGGFEAF